MKNEPALTYNHMEEEGASQIYKVENQETGGHPISLYMILAVDVILMGALAVIAFKVIF